MTNNIKIRKGFTIIEVVLVLAIAGLIFMMVFIALPALQRSQRDTQRGSDVSRFITQITQYQSNNRGAIPGTKKGYVTSEYGGEYGTDIETTASGTDVKNWKSFYDGYMLVKSNNDNSTASDSFEDPSGAPYQLSIDLCEPDSKTAGAPCKNSVQRTNATFESGYTEGNIGDSENQNYTISVVINATCTGETATYSAGNRKVAAVYKKEGGGVMCYNN